MKRSDSLGPYHTKKAFITHDSVDTFVLERSPDFLEYLFFHNILDKYCFALKSHYSDRDTVRTRRYRLDLVFQNYLIHNGAHIFKKSRGDVRTTTKSAIEFNLTKGWHNELVRSDPIAPDYLRIGVQLSRHGGPGRGGLAAWNIVQSYYAFYEYFSTLCACILPEVQIDGHKKLARNINSQILGLASKSVLFYPFTLTSATRSSSIPAHPQYSQFHYASYPREPGKHISQIDHEIVMALRLLSKDLRTKSILDLLYEFRVWANYTGVQSILKLSDGGYLGFLMKNLATLVFFAGGMAELSAIRVLGQARFLSMLRRFQNEYVNKSERFSGNRFLLPCHVRLLSYKHVGVVSQSIRAMMPALEDPVQFITMPRAGDVLGT